MFTNVPRAGSGHSPRPPSFVDVQAVWEADSQLEGEQACEELRAHGIKCDLAEPSTPYVPGGMAPDVSLQVVVAVADAEQAAFILSAWHESQKCA